MTAAEQYRQAVLVTFAGAAGFSAGFFIRCAITALALLFGAGCISRQYTVNVYGDAPLSIRIAADVSHETDASIPITAKLK